MGKISIDRPKTVEMPLRMTKPLAKLGRCNTAISP